MSSLAKPPGSILDRCTHCPRQSSLAGIRLTTTAAVYVAPGFNVNDLSLRLSGSSKLHADGLVAQTVSAAVSG